MKTKRKDATRTLALSLALSGTLAGMVRAAEMIGSAASPAQMAVAISARLGALTPQVGGALDTNALLDSLKSSPDSVSAALTAALADPAQFAQVEAMLDQAKDAQPQAVAQAVKAMEQWHRAVQADELAKSRFKAHFAMAQAQGVVKSAAGSVAFDNGLAGAASNGEAVALETPAPTPMPMLQKAAAKAAVPSIWKAAPAPKLAFSEEPQIERQQKETVALSAADQAKVDSYVDQLMQIDPADVRTSEQARLGVKNFGVSASLSTNKESKLLEASIREISKHGNGKELGTALAALRFKAQELDPSKIKIGQKGAWLRVMSMIPGVGTPVSRYMAKYQSAQSTIETIEQSLVNGKTTLASDNKTLLEDQIRMSNLERQLAQTIAFAEHIDKGLEERLADPNLDVERRKFLQEEVLFPLKQRVQDLLAQRVVNQQGAASARLLIVNNEELIKAVDRTLNTIGPALRIGVATAVALDRQQSVLDAEKGTRDFAADLLVSNAERLRIQGVDIQKQASEAVIDPDKLMKAFDSLNAAMDDLSNFRVQALDRMRTQIARLDEAAEKGEKALQRMERGAAPRAQILSQLDPSKHLSGGKY